MLLVHCVWLPPKKTTRNELRKYYQFGIGFCVRSEARSVVKIKRNVFLFIPEIMKRSLNNISFIKMIYHMICVGSVCCRHFTCVCGWAHWLNLPTARTRWECQKNKTAEDKTQYIRRMEKKESVIVITTIAQTLYTKKNIARGAYKSFCYSVVVVVVFFLCVFCCCFVLCNLPKGFSNIRHILSNIFTSASLVKSRREQQKECSVKYCLSNVWSRGQERDGETGRREDESKIRNMQQRSQSRFSNDVCWCNSLKCVRNKWK